MFRKIFTTLAFTFILTITALAQSQQVGASFTYSDHKYDGPSVGGNIEAVLASDKWRILAKFAAGQTRKDYREQWGTNVTFGVSTRYYFFKDILFAGAGIADHRFYIDATNKKVTESSYTKKILRPEVEGGAAIKGSRKQLWIIRGFHGFRGQQTAIVHLSRDIQVPDNDVTQTGFDMTFYQDLKGRFGVKAAAGATQAKFFQPTGPSIGNYSLWNFPVSAGVYWKF